MHNVEWLELTIETWQLMCDFKTFKGFATNLPVINDSVERKINLLKTLLILVITNRNNNYFQL